MITFSDKHIMFIKYRNYFTFGGWVYMHMLVVFPRHSPRYFWRQGLSLISVAHQFDQDGPEASGSPISLFPGLGFQVCA